MRLEGLSKLNVASSSMGDVCTALFKYLFLPSSGYKMEEASFFDTLILYLARMYGVRAKEINRKRSGWGEVLIRVFEQKGD